MDAEKLFYRASINELFLETPQSAYSAHHRIKFSSTPAARKLFSRQPSADTLHAATNRAVHTQFVYQTMVWKADLAPGIDGTEW